VFITFVNFVVNSEKLDKYRLWEEGLVQVAYKMLTQSHFIAFNDIKFNKFFKRVE